MIWPLEPLQSRALLWVRRWITPNIVFAVLFLLKKKASVHDVSEKLITQDTDNKQQSMFFAKNAILSKKGVAGITH